MTSMSAPGPRRSWLRAAAVRAGHTLDPWQPLLSVTLLVPALIRWWLPNTWTYAGPGLALIAFGLLAALLSGVHRNSLCERDGLEFLDPQAAVQEHLTSLRLHHNRRLSFLLSAQFIAFAMTGTLSWMPVWGKIVVSVAAAGMWAAYAAYEHRTAIHTPLHLWCPWCPRFRGDGDDDHTPAPQPQPSGTVVG